MASAALLLNLAYPPIHLFVTSFVCVVPAVWLIIKGEADPRPLRRHLLQGVWFGLLAWGAGLYWMPIALWSYTPLAVPAYAAALTLAAGYGALLFGLVGWIRRATRLSLAVVFPILWTAVEWMTAHQPELRFPWLGLGTSLTGFPTVVQFADVVGARGITFLLAAANAALALAWARRHDQTAAVRLVARVGLGLLLALAYGIVREHTLPVRRAVNALLVQPNIGLAEKWSPAAQDSVVAGVTRLSAEGARVAEPDLIVWPETAAPGYFAYHPVWERLIADHARRADAVVVVGALDLQSDGSGSFGFYNAAFLFSPRGSRDAQPPYHKRRLVLLVERFGGLQEGGSSPLFWTDRGRFGVLICYEAAFEELARGYRADGADFLLNLSNDTWFGRGAAAYQHPAHLVMRAIENRVGIARAANSGISVFVDPLGRQHHGTRLGERTFVAGEVATSGVVTIYTRLGDWVGWLSIGGAAALCGLAFRRRGASRLAA